MKDWRGIHRSTLVSFLVLTLLLVGTAVVIFQQIGRLSRSESLNQRRMLAAALFNSRREFTGQLLDLSRDFEPAFGIRTIEDLETQMMNRYQRIMQDRRDFGLVSQLYLLLPNPDGTGSLHRFDPEQGVFIRNDPQDPKDDSWFLKLATLNLTPIPGMGPRSRRLVFVEERFLIQLPYDLNRSPLRGRRRPRPPGRRPSALPPGPGPEDEFAGRHQPRAASILIELETDRLREVLLPGLKKTYFGGPGLSGLEVAVLVDSQETPLYQSDPALDSSFFSLPDDEIPLTTPGGWLDPVVPGRNLGLKSDPDFFRRGTLNLVARHRLGSLEAAAATRRFHDLLWALAILLLIGGTAATLVVSVQRTRAFARRQMDFVAGVSHELRNPLTAIQAAGFNLSRGTVQDGNKIREYGNLISRESRRLVHMVEQVLSYAGIERSSDQYDLQLVHLEEIVLRVLEEYAQPLEKEGWNLEREIEKGLSPVIADVQALESCTRNLLDNALKYANEDKRLQIRLTSTEHRHQPMIELSVRDHGPGIPNSELKSLFEPFYRGPRHASSTVPGAGLGLALVKRHVEAHGGRVHVSSEAGKGTRFSLIFPADRSPDGKAK